ncbi:LacI family DNA-binding transcriptional regulator [Propionimicrobium sp. PCR01-08-3]|uniref:LacI family DNA-binding transcriptional regulator n=1 Tax=Propionimicrobium sp. PCR01-08-3 TaxID=3052086 RepID=UPI00255C589D|nr:LacI family DNA-binding transcriptional regulator [Propionimicrobium sp. PCR01-08-3]WIY83103.1 LacI family DNA-binding transcriptional regulator [Propionimicrobium sp. PCR01-08-3]
MQGKLPRPVTMKDVAAAAQVSSATVSRVLSGKSTVDPEMAKRVHEAVEATGYVPNFMGMALRRQVTNTWAIIVSNIENPFFTRLVASMEEAAEYLGYSVMLCNTNEQVDRENRYINAVIQRRMSGVAIAAASAVRTDLTPLTRAGIPVVLIDRLVQGYDGDSVVVDNALIGRLAAEHFAAQGYRRFGCVAGPRHVSSMAHRLEGFRTALRERGIDLPNAMVSQTDLRGDSGEFSVANMLNQPDAPDAIFSGYGVTTAGAYRAIKGRGLSMPRDIGLVGTDDEAWMTLVQPSVTVIRQPVEQIGIAAAQLLNARSAHPDSPSQHLVLQPTLVERESSRGFANHRTA